MINILFAIDGLRSGGKERRFLSLLKHLILLKNFYCEVIILNKDVHYKEVFDLDVKLHFLVRKRKKDLSIIVPFFLIAKSFQPDIIHCWDTLSALYAIPTATLTRTKLIVSNITYAPVNYKKFSSFGIASEIIFKFSDQILSNSRAGIKAYNISDKKSSVIYNGFDFDRLKNLDTKEKVRITFGIKEPFLVGMVASFSRNKDFKNFLLAAKSIRTMYKNIGFICVGDGILRKELEERFTATGIYFTGLLNDVESVMNICDVGVLLTNINNHGEGISNSLMEFMAMGKPVIATRNGGNTELIEDKASGTIIEQNNPEKIAELILDNYNNIDKYKKIGSIAKRRIEDSFLIKRMIDEFKLTYKNILK